MGTKITVTIEGDSLDDVLTKLASAISAELKDELQAKAEPEQDDKPDKNTKAADKKAAAIAAKKKKAAAAAKKKKEEEEDAERAEDDDEIDGDDLEDGDDESEGGDDDEDDEDDEDEDTESNVVDIKKKKKAAAAAKKKAAAAAKKKSANGKGKSSKIDVEPFKEISRLKKLVEEFENQGIDDPDDMVEILMEIKGELPYLKRMSEESLPKRIKTAYDMVHAD